MDSDELLARQRLGEQLRGWRLERLLGVGGMAAVYAAVNAEGRQAAVKVLHPEMSRRPDIRERFLREGAAANRVGHAGVVQVLDTEVADDGTALLVMELLEGEPLTEVVNRQKGLSQERLLDVLDQVLDVLASAHAQGIIHRDLKPDNLFLTKDGRVKVLDFGIARLLEDVPGSYKTKTGVTLGTVPFMAPEQALARRGQIDGRTDLFALGAMAFRILSGRNVHEADSETELLVAMASTPAPPLSSVASDVPPNVTAIVDLALAFSRDARYPDARTMQTDVRAAREGRPPPYASRTTTSRLQATRVELPAPAPAVTGVEPQGVEAAQGAQSARPLSRRPSALEAADTEPVSALPPSSGLPGYSPTAPMVAAPAPRAPAARRAPWAAVGALLLLVGGALAYFLLRSPDGATTDELPAPLVTPAQPAEVPLGSPGGPPSQAETAEPARPTKARTPGAVELGSSRAEAEPGGEPPEVSATPAASVTAPPVASSQPATDEKAVAPPETTAARETPAAPDTEERTERRRRGKRSRSDR